MKIVNSAITMNSKSTYKEASNKTETIKAWSGNKYIYLNSSLNQNDMEESISGNTYEHIKKELGKLSSPKQADTKSSFLLPSVEECRLRVLNTLLEMLMGKKLKFLIPSSVTSDGTQAVSSRGGQAFGWGLDYECQEDYSESETMNFSAAGTVNTSDGKQIKLNVELAMSRSFYSQHSLSIKAGDALTDPLVINFGQSGAGLTQNKYSFDLDNDGKADRISFTTGDSGFLVLDKNGDGKINNGSELFGPNSGDGFLELKAYDSDGNNWIDENDPIYDKLQIWMKDENGNDHLFALGQKGIGAIYLGSVSSSFSLKDSGNTTLGQVQKTGIFLRENGTAGTIQHVDISL